MFKLIINGDPSHELNRGFGWQGEMVAYERKLRDNEYVTSIDLVDRLAGNCPLTGDPIIRRQRVYTRPAGDTIANIASAKATL